MSRVEKIRLSLGTAIQMGLVDGRPDPAFTTAFLMTYRNGRCMANCAFCPQARGSSGHSDRLSRIAWPDFPLDVVISGLKDTQGFQRVCIQCLSYPRFVDDVVLIAHRIRTITSLPLSAATGPIDIEEMLRLRDAGVDNIGIAVDASTPDLFDRIKGKERKSKYRWISHIESLKQALSVFGAGHVTTHLIVGLGETEAEALQFLKSMYEMGVSVGLFAFTAIRGTALEQLPPPDMASYRRIQVARYVLAHDLLPPSKILIDERGRIHLDVEPEWIRRTVGSGDPFRTSGCAGCNRPYYNERPSGPLYNYHRPLTDAELVQALTESELV